MVALICGENSALDIYGRNMKARKCLRCGRSMPFPSASGICALCAASKAEAGSPRSSPVPHALYGVVSSPLPPPLPRESAFSFQNAAEVLFRADKVWLAAGVSVCMGLLFTGGLVIGVKATSNHGAVTAEETLTSKTQRGKQLFVESARDVEASNKAFVSRSALTKRIDPSVVLIHAESRDGESIGSGFLVDAHGIVATNKHVVEPPGRLTVAFCDGSTATTVEILYVHPTLDLALLQIRVASVLPAAIPLAKELPAKGDDVAVFGAPEGLDFTTSFGNVSAVRVDGRETWIQFTAPISPGNSGGPVINSRGEVVGMTTWTYAGKNSQNLNFALSSIDIVRVLTRLKAADLLPL